MQNPRLLEIGYKKDKLPFRMKAYRPVVGRIARGVFRTATEAQHRAVEVYARWCRLYDAAIVAMAIKQVDRLYDAATIENTNPSPVSAEEGQVVTE